MKLFILQAQDHLRFDHLYSRTLSTEIKPGVLALGAVDDEAQPPQAVGLLVARVMGSHVMLEWLYVAAGCRRRGVATALLDCLLSAATREHTLRQLMVLLSAKQDDVLSFLDDFGFGILFQEHCGEFHTSLADIPRLTQKPLPDYQILPLHQASAAQLSTFHTSLAQKEHLHCGVPLPIVPADYAPESMVCSIQGKLCGLCLVRAWGDSIDIPWVYAIPTRGKQILPRLFDAVLHALSQRYLPETPVRFATMTRASEALAEHLLPNAEWIELYTAIWAL